MFELVVIFENDNKKYVYEYETYRRAKQGQKNMYLVFGNQIVYAGIREKTNASRLNNFQKVEIANRIIEDAKREILLEDPSTDFGYYLAFFTDYGIKKEDVNDIYRMLYTRIFSGDGIQEIMQADNYFDIGIWV